MYYTTVPQHLASDPVLGKRYGNADAMRLRDYRKRLDEPISAEEVDQVSSAHPSRPMVGIDSGRGVDGYGVDRGGRSAEFGLYWKHHYSKGQLLVETIQETVADLDRGRSSNEPPCPVEWPSSNVSLLTWRRLG